ncbi:MAG: shikimate kinase [Peptostreptococcales bacterium]
MNIVLIGMAGCGKSTIGVLLAKALGMSFVDTDLLIQEREERLLQEIIDLDGLQKFINIEEKVILSLNIDHSVIATGGSAVYGNFAMEHLKKKGKIIFLNLSYENIEKRIKNITTRGIAMNKGQTLRDVFDERMNLYLKYADIEIDCDDKDIEEIIEEIVTKISKESI